MVGEDKLQMDYIFQRVKLTAFRQWLFAKPKEQIQKVLLNMKMYTTALDLTKAYTNAFLPPQ